MTSTCTWRVRGAAGRGRGCGVCGPPVSRWGFSEGSVADLMQPERGALGGAVGTEQLVGLSGCRGLECTRCDRSMWVARERGLADGHGTAEARHTSQPFRCIDGANESERGLLRHPMVLKPRPRGSLAIMRAKDRPNLISITQGTASRIAAENQPCRYRSYSRVLA